MQENKIHPEKITKPIQLLAAWLLGLILLVSALLTGAGTIHNPYWLSAFLAISAVAIIPMFLILIFLLQTKYRPEMQEDTYYSKYLDRNTMTFEYVDKKDIPEIEYERLNSEIVKLSTDTKAELEIIKKIIEKDGVKTNDEKRIEEIIEQSDEKLEELKRIAKFTNLDLRINKFLPSYNDILTVIKNIGFTKYQEFGTPNLPKIFLLSIGKKVSLDIARELIFDLIPLGLTNVKVTQTTVKEPNRDYTIFIGSYSVATVSTPVNEKLIDRLKDASDKQFFEEII